MKRTSTLPLLHSGAIAFGNLLVKASILAAVIAILFLSSEQVLAIPINWGGSIAGDWDTAVNWDPNQVPTSTDAVTIPTGSAVVVGSGFLRSSDYGWSGRSTTNLALRV